jgi:hypothetical protein
MSFNFTSREEEYAVLILKLGGRGEFFQRNFALVIFGVQGGVSRYAATPLIVVLSPDHSGITNLRLWSPVGTVNYLDRAKRKITKLSLMTGTVDDFICVQAFRDPLRGDL